MIFEKLFKRKVYCQNCGNDITDLGGWYVPYKSEIFCNKDETCLLGITKSPSIEYKNSREVQKDIKDGKLIHYNKLERKIPG